MTEMFKESINRELLAQLFQEYLNESPVQDSVVGPMLEGHKGTLFSQATELFNDVLLYAGEGEEPLLAVVDPTIPGLGEGA